MILQFLLFVIQVANLILIGRVLLSWFPDVDRNNPFVRFLYDVTEPFLRPLRQLVPPQSGFDLSPLIAFVILMVASRVLVQIF